MNESSAAQRILVVDDSRVTLLTVRKILQDAGFTVSTAQSAEEGLSLIAKTGLPHLALVDLNMPGGMDGYAFAAALHEYSDVPVIMVSAVDEEQTVVAGLEQHAEDYVTKPFRSSELIARVRRVLNRMGDYAYTFDPVLQIDERLSVNLPERQAILDGVGVALTPTETKLLYILLKNAGRVVTAEFLLRRVWPFEEAYEDRLHAHVYRLRRKIEPDPKEPRYIISEWGTGYRFPARQS